MSTLRIKLTVESEETVDERGYGRRETLATASLDAPAAMVWFGTVLNPTAKAQS